MKTERILFIDLARGLAVLFMVMVHVLEEMSEANVIESWFGAVVEFLGGPPAAPVFMFLMGTSLVFSRRHNVRRSMVRGLRLLALAYALNFLRGTLPAWLGLQLNLFSRSDIAPYTPANLFWIVDILHFAGLALIVLAFVRRYLPQPWHWLALGGAVAVFSPLLWGRMSGVPLVDWLLALLWGTGDSVAFPVFPWLFFPLCGMAFGYGLMQTADRERYLRRTAWLGLGALILGTLITLTDYDFHLGDYWRSGPGALLWMTGFVLLVLYLCHVAVKKSPSNAFFTVLYDWSAHVTVFYVIHWILIGWLSFYLTWWIAFDTIIAAVLAMALIALAADFFTRRWMLKYG